MTTLAETVEAWAAGARVKLENGGLHAEDLDELVRAVRASRNSTRQRLLYLHAATPSVRSQVIGMALHEPVRGQITQITVANSDWRYSTVHDAVLDGWQVIHFPDQRAPYDDHEIDVLGYEFILQKLEVYDE